MHSQSLRQGLRAGGALARPLKGHFQTLMLRFSTFASLYGEARPHMQGRPNHGRVLTTPALTTIRLNLPLPVSCYVESCVRVGRGGRGGAHLLGLHVLAQRRADDALVVLAAHVVAQQVARRHAPRVRALRALALRHVVHQLLGHGAVRRGRTRALPEPIDTRSEADGVKALVGVGRRHVER
jgi:hypothetical protein